jgi:hypothetical protein
MTEVFTHMASIDSDGKAAALFDFFRHFVGGRFRKVKAERGIRWCW